MSSIQSNSEQKSTVSNEDFSLASLRMKQNFGDLAGAKKLLNTVPVRKPHKQTFVRVSPNPDNVIKTMLLELDNETYLVAQDLWADLSEELVPKALFLTITRQKVLQLWPVRLPPDDARTDVWSISSIQAVEAAQNRWVRVRSNMDLGAYEVIEATGAIPEPDWPDTPFEEIVRIAFKGRYITSLDHTAIRQLKGQI